MHSSKVPILQCATTYRTPQGLSVETHNYACKGQQFPLAISCLAGQVQRLTWTASWQNQQSECAHSENLQVSLGIRPVWTYSSLCTQWVAKDPSFLHADSKDSEQTGRMPRLIWVFAGRTCHFVGFVMRRLKDLWSTSLFSLKKYTAGKRLSIFWFSFKLRIQHIKYVVLKTYFYLKNVFIVVS